MNKITCAIAGGTGYTAGELLRILLYHPFVEIVAVFSSSFAGARIDTIHRDLIGETDLCFCNELPKTDLLFLCLGHGLSGDFLEKNNIDPQTKVIDLGSDFRITPFFGDREFVYGLPELNRYTIRMAQNIANPGCFATAIQLALLPLAQQKLLLDEVHVHAITGSTGAGRELSSTAHFSYRSNNISVYKAFTHQHLEEIHASLAFAANKPTPQINFIPVRGDFTRGIFATLYTRCPANIEEVSSLYQTYYQSHPFVFVAQHEISLKEVVNTNKNLLHLQKHQDYLLITSIIDNLTKGASGQAVQNMNLMFGWDETMGLQLKPTAF
ncbi:MAG: N-acetyl-gamma-glutamyl-phosphate reductase [Prevotellaceae bacterium]|jgi:N-acetyl-gamma-glutamyl-phosphate reductase|nr:N-acetyl-gamma-glutamyl-phosphate reductase [Prevotellaceae bacterium]